MEPDLAAIFAEAVANGTAGPMFMFLGTGAVVTLIAIGGVWRRFVVGIDGNVSGGEEGGPTEAQR